MNQSNASRKPGEEKEYTISEFNVIGTFECEAEPGKDNDNRMGASRTTDTGRAVEGR